MLEALYCIVGAHSLQWRHYEHDGVSNGQPHHCLLNRSFGCKSKKTSKLRVTGLCVGNSPGTGEFPAQMASNAENASIWWRHHATCTSAGCTDMIASWHTDAYPEADLWFMQIIIAGQCSKFILLKTLWKKRNWAGKMSNKVTECPYSAKMTRKAFTY